MKTIFKKVSAAVMALAVMSTAAALVFNEPETIAAEAGDGDGTQTDTDPHEHKVCVNSENCLDCSHEDITWDKLTAASDLSKDGSYYLTSDITLDSEITIGSGVNVTLCLNGHTIDAQKKSRIFNINGGELTLCDCAGNGKLTKGSADNGGAVYVNGGTFTLKGGSISKNHPENNGGAVYVSNGTFTMDGGSLSDNTAGHEGGGVYVGNNGIFEMNGGTISGNIATCLTVDSNGVSGNGGGVYTAGTFTMNNGIISGNIATGNNTINPQKPILAYGGGLCVNGGTTTMNGGEIINNTSQDYGGGVCVASKGIFNMIGGKINENTANSGGGGICLNDSDNATLRLNGKVCITPNYKSDKRNADIYLTKANTKQKKITIGANFAPIGGKIGIQAQTHPTCTSYVDVTKFDTGVNKKIDQLFKSDDSKYGIFNTAANTVQLSAPHNPTPHQTIAPTCTDDGTEAYWECTVCGKKFDDSNCTNVIEATKEIPATGHDYSLWEITKEPTYTEEGEIKYICANDNSHTYPEPLAMLTHATPVPPASDYSASTSSAPASSDDSSSIESSTPAESSSPGESSATAESNTAENSSFGENNVVNDAPYTGAEISILPIAACVAAASAAIAKRSKENK